MNCCLTNILSCVVQSFGVVVSTLVALVILIYSVKMLWKLIFPVQKRHSDGYQPQWFGREHQALSNNDSSVRPFKISVPDDVLEDLKTRLSSTRYEEPVADSKFQYGFNPNYLKKVVDYWRKEYDWRKQEEMLNQYPQYKTRIEGLDVHFFHVKPKLPTDSNLKVLPLMLIHGWPGSVVEFYKIIPLLTTPRPGQDFVFEVICPSIPGYGFSESPHRKGFTARCAARFFLTLMDRIGYHEFYVQGGDWGSTIAHIMARCYSSRVLGLHLNLFFSGMKKWEMIKFIIISYFPFFISKAEYKLCYPIKRLLTRFYEEGGYFHIQTTKPDTIGCAMSSNPAGMAAYILEKFAFWVNPEYVNLEDGGLTEKFSLDELLTNVMLYWVNNNFTAAARFYKENILPMHEKQFDKLPIVVPTGLAIFPHEIAVLPKTCVSQTIKNLVSYNIMPRGGHFAAFEEPELLANDVWNFVSKIPK